MIGSEFKGGTDRVRGSDRVPDQREHGSGTGSEVPPKATVHHLPVRRDGHFNGSIRRLREAQPDSAQEHLRRATAQHLHAVLDALICLAAHCHENGLDGVPGHVEAVALDLSGTVREALTQRATARSESSGH